MKMMEIFEIRLYLKMSENRSLDTHTTPFPPHTYTHTHAHTHTPTLTFEHTRTNTHTLMTHVWTVEKQFKVFTESFCLSA